jgi:hypothetical protein
MPRLYVEIVFAQAIRQIVADRSLHAEIEPVAPPRAMDNYSHSRGMLCRAGVVTPKFYQDTSAV